jgi:hypothetical protein
LILLALLCGGQLLYGENLTTPGTIEHGHFYYWRKNARVRGERSLHMPPVGPMRPFRSIEPRNTMHTWDRCQQPACTCAFPASVDRTIFRDWGAWLCGENLFLERRTRLHRSRK